MISLSRRCLHLAVPVALVAALSPSSALSAPARAAPPSESGSASPDGLAHPAIELLARAQETLAPADFAAAADAFDALTRTGTAAFTSSELAWYRAYALVGAERTEAAETALRAIVTDARSPFADQSRLQLLVVLERRLDAAYDLGRLPEGVPVEAVVSTAAGGTYTRHVLPAEIAAYVELIDALAAYAGSDPEVTRYLADRRPMLLVSAGQLLHALGRHDEARARLLPVIERWPESGDATLATRLVVDGHRAQGDYARVAAYALELKQRLPADAAVWQDVRTEALVMLAGDAARQKRAEEAVTLYLAVLQESPRPELTQYALQQAATLLRELGRPADAVPLYERLLEVSEDPYLAAAIARLHESLGYPERAVAFYEKQFERHPTQFESRDALARSAELRAEAGDLTGAARSLERFAAAYPDDPQAELALWGAASQWEAVGNAEALAFYARYSASPLALPARDVEARCRSGTLLTASGAPAEAAVAFERARAAAQTVPPDALSSDAVECLVQADLDALEARVAALSAPRWTKNQTQNSRALDELLAARDTLVQDAHAVTRRFTRVSSTLGAAYVEGVAYLRVADLLERGPSWTPPRADAAATDLTAAVARESAASAEAGRERLEEALRAVEAHNVLSPWTSRIRAVLAERFPARIAP